MMDALSLSWACHTACCRGIGPQLFKIMYGGWSLIGALGNEDVVKHIALARCSVFGMFFSVV